MITVHPIQTGKVKVKQFQATGAKNLVSRFWQLIFTNKWTDWHPVYCWLVAHPEGPFLIDAGEIARVQEPGYLPGGPLFEKAVQYDVRREDEVDAQLKKLGVGVDQIRAVYLTHFHSDHADGLVHFPHAVIHASKEAYDSLMSPKGERLGYFKKNIPAGLQVETFEFDEGPEGVFESSQRLFPDGSLVAVPAPGHSMGHSAYILQSGSQRFVFSGDATYNQYTMETGVPFVILNNHEAEETVEKLHTYAQSPDVVVLCSHDPDVPGILSVTKTG